MHHIALNILFILLAWPYTMLLKYIVNPVIQAYVWIYKGIRNHGIPTWLWIYLGMVSAVLTVTGLRLMYS